MPIKQDNIELFCRILQDEFALKSKPVIQVARIKYFPFECFGLYEGKIAKKKPHHIITIDPKNVRNKKQLFATLAHEYVHAWQMQEGLKLKHDKRSEFKAWTDYFQTVYNINIIGMY